MTPISMGIQSPLVISCPCVALPKETVVVNRWAALIAVGVLTAAGYCEAALSLQTALEKKP